MKVILEYIKTVINLFNEFGAKKVYKAVLFIMMLLFIINFNKYENFIYKNFNDYVEIQHQKSIKYREKINPEISNLLLRLINQTKCDYAIEAEYHNGDKSLSGLSFKKFSILYEEVNNDSLPLLANNYHQCLNSLYKFTNYLYNRSTLNMSIKELRKIDNRLANELAYYGIKRINIYNIYIEGEPKAFLMLLFKDNYNEIELEYINANAYKTTHLIRTKLEAV